MDKKLGSPLKSLNRLCRLLLERYTAYIYAYNNNEKEAIYLKESKEGYMRGPGSRNEKEVMI